MEDNISSGDLVLISKIKTSAAAIIANANGGTAIVINHEDCGAAKIVNGKKEFNSTIEKKIHKDSFKKIKLTLSKKFPKLKLSFKILTLRD